MADKDAEEGRTTPFNAAVRFDPIKAKVALHESTPSASEPSTRKRASFVPDTLEKRRQEEGRAEEDAEEDAEDDAEAGLVKMPPVSDHTFYILLRQPKGGISGKNALQRLAAKLTSRFDRVDHFGNIVQSDTVVIKASRSEPYLVDNGKNGKHYLVLTAQTPAKNSEKVAEAIRSWPEVIGLQRLYALETMLFHAFADVYDVSEGRCIPVPSRGSGKKLSLSHAPNPAISLDALEQMVSRLDLGLSSAQVRASFGANAHATAPRLSWHSVALHVTRCLRPNRHIIENALAVLDASSSSSSSSSPAGAQQGTATTDQLRTTLLTLSDKLGLDAASIAAVVHRAQVMSEGSKRIDYKRFLANVCSGLEATASPPPHALAARQQMARKLEGNRSREVAKLIADDWKALDEKERAKFEELAAKDYKRYCREKHTELKAAKRRMGQVDGAEDEGVTEHELPRWGVGSEVKPPRSAFSFFSSNELARFGSDDSFNKLFRVPTANSGGAGGGNGVTSSEPGGASFQRLMNFKGFCAWFAALPLPVKAGLFSQPAALLVCKCPPTYQAMVARKLSVAKQKQASMSGEVEARMRERSRVRAILSSRPGLQLLFEAYALEIPESLLEVLVQSHKMNLASAVRMAQDFHIIPVYVSRQQVANAYKKFRVYEKDKTTGVTHGLTVEAFVRFLEEVAACCSIPILEKTILRTQGRSLTLLDKFDFLTGGQVLSATNSVGLLDLKLRLKMNPRVYAFVAQNVPILEEFLTQKKEMMARRVQEQHEKTKLLLQTQERCGRWARLTRLTSLGFLTPNSVALVAARQVFIGYCTAKGGPLLGRKDLSQLRISLPQIKRFFVDMKLVPDSNLTATGVSYGSTPLLTSTELADIYQNVSASSILSIDTDRHSKEAKRAVASDPVDGTLEPLPHEIKARAAGKNSRNEKTHEKLPTPIFSQHGGLRLPEFVYLLQSVAFHIYSSSDVFEAAYTSDYDKVEALYQRLLFFNHASLRSVLINAKVLRGDSTWPDTLQYPVSGLLAALAAGDPAPTVLQYGHQVVASSEVTEAAMVLAHLTDKTAELQLALRRKSKSGIGALRSGLKRLNSQGQGESMAGSPVAFRTASAGRRGGFDVSNLGRTASSGFGRTASSGFGRTGSAATAVTSRGAVGSEHVVEDWFESGTFHYDPQASSQLSAPMLQQWMSSTPKSSSPDKFGKSSPLLKGDRQARKEKLAQRQQEIMHAGSMQVDIPTSPLGGVEQRQLGMETQGPVAGGSWQSLQDVSQGSWSVHDANRRNAAYSSDRSSQDGGESLDVQAFTDAQRMRQELATDELTILQHHRHLLEEAKASPHLVPAPLLGEEAHFLKWVASRKDIGGGGDGGSKEESDKQMAAAAGLVLDALRSEEERLRQRRKQLDENLQDLIYDPASSLARVDADKIVLRRPVGRWWERADRGFTEENSRNNLMVKLSASGRRPWVHSKYGVCMTQVAEGSPELDRLEKQRLYQNVGRAQRRGESWCAAPLDKSLQMPGSGIKKQQRFSAAPAQDPMKMELGDEVRSKDGWLWVVRSCGGKRNWVRTTFESNIKKSESKTAWAALGKANLTKTS